MIPCETKAHLLSDYDSRGKRRNDVNSIFTCLITIRDAEQNYLENTPDNFQSSESFDAGESVIDALDEIIDLLVDVY